MQCNRFFSTGICSLVLVTILCCPFQGWAANTWSYHQENDRLNNQTYSVALSPMPRRDLYDELKLEIICRDKHLQVVINADSLIASQGSQFDVEYQIDKLPPMSIQMRTFPDSKRRGYTNDEARRLVDAMLTGRDSVFIRVKTMIRETLSGAIPLLDAVQALQQVLSDCGMAVPANTGSEPAYSLAGFERDFNQLTPAQQQQVLERIKKILMDLQ